jgi:integrase
MTRPSAGARLYQRKRNGRPTVWCIRDGASEVSTGTIDRRQAEIALAEYIRRKDATADAAKMTCGDVIEIYMKEHGAHVSDTERLKYSFKAIFPFWGKLYVRDVNASRCRQYVAARGVSPGTVRRELSALRAAINYAHREGLLDASQAVWMPPAPDPKERWLTRSEAALLLWSAYRNPRTRHLARFILIGLYTGTRKQAILSLQFTPSRQGGWIDTENGVLYRSAIGEAKTKKRKPPARLPRQMLAHARRWERQGAKFAVEINGKAVDDIKHSFATAVKRSGIDPGVVPHTLRHTAITWAMQRGARPFDVSGYFGVSIETLTRVYAHHSPDFQDSAVRAMERVSGA